VTPVSAGRLASVALSGTALLLVALAVIGALTPTAPVVLPTTPVDLPAARAQPSQPQRPGEERPGELRPGELRPGCDPAPSWLDATPDRTSRPAPALLVRSWHGAGHDGARLRVVAVQVDTARAHLSVAVPVRLGAVLSTADLTRRAHAVLGMNGDYFDRGPAGAFPRGVEVRRGVVLHAPAGPTKGVGVDAHGGIHAGDLTVEGSVEAATGARVAPLAVTSVNTNRPAERGVGLRTAFGGTRSWNAVWYVLVHRGTVVASSAGDPGPPSGTDVLLQAPPAEQAALAAITTGTRVRITVGVRTADGVRLTEAMGSSDPVLEGAAITASCTGTFGTGKRPRSVLAWDGAHAQLWLITVNSVTPGESGTGVHGLTYSETADLARHLGATDAVLLDGGHSTTLVVPGDGSRADAPSSAPVRLVANALVVTLV